MLAVENLSLGYAGKPILENLSFSVGSGRILCILGPSGIGKTTILKGLAGLLPPLAGRVTLDCQEITGPHPEVGILMQHDGLIPWRTTEKNISLPLSIRAFYGPDGRHCPRDWKRDRDRDRDIVEALLRDFELTGLRRRFPDQLSGGQRRRTAIARTIAPNPRLMLLDEPMAFLDSGLAGAVKERILLTVRENDRAGIVVTHSLDTAMAMGDSLMLLADSPSGTVRLKLSESEGIDKPSWKARIDEFLGEGSTSG